MNKRAIQALTAVAFVAVGVFVWKLNSADVEPAPPTPAPAPAAATPTTEQPAVARPKAPVVAEPKSADPCVEARKWFEGQPGSAMPDTDRGALELSWDAGLAFGAGEPPQVVPAAYHATPVASAPVGDVELKVKKDERIQSIIALTADAQPRVLALVWAGIDLSDPDKLAPEGEDLEAWEAYRKARLELRYYAWNKASGRYAVEDTVAGSVTKCESPFGCDELLAFPRPRIEAIGGQLVMVRTKVQSGCEAEEHVCAALEWAAVYAVGPDGTRQLFQLPLEIYSAERPTSPPMRHRVFMFEPRFQDMDGDGQLDLALRTIGERYVKFLDPTPEPGHEGHEPGSEATVTGNEIVPGHDEEEEPEFSRYVLRDSMFPNRNPFAVRWLIRDGQLIEVDRTFTDVLREDWNLALRAADKKLTAMTVASVMRVLRGLAVAVEALPDVPGPRPDTSLDRGLTCLVADLTGEGKPLCSVLGRVRILVNDRDQVVRLLVGALSLVEQVKADVPAEPMGPVTARFEALFGALCPASGTQ